jgi:hypothetical protein
MRIFCRQCGSSMRYVGLGTAPGPAQSAGLEFACGCSGIFMVVNGGEAMLVKSMGVKLGPETGPPFELAQLASAAPRQDGVPWSPAAWERAQRIPESVRSMIIRAVAGFAESQGRAEITEAVLEEFKSSQGLPG